MSKRTVTRAGATHGGAGLAGRCRHGLASRGRGRIALSRAGLVLVAVSAATGLAVFSASPPVALASTAAGSTAPAPPPPGGPMASAWALQVSMQAGQNVVALGEVNAQSGQTPSASAVPITLNGQTPIIANSSPTVPNTDASKVNWVDPTGSMTIQGGTR